VEARNPFTGSPVSLRREAMDQTLYSVNPNGKLPPLQVRQVEVSLKKYF
jgi:hypothetical protein